MSFDPEWVGIPAALLTTAGYMPQAIKAVREKHTKSLSKGMYFLMVAGSLTWLVYGILLESPAIILANSGTLVLTSFILFMKFRHG
jgi:MtN3 and saliva related transmembrane protein